MAPVPEKTAAQVAWENSRAAPAALAKPAAPAALSNAGRASSKKLSVRQRQSERAREQVRASEWSVVGPAHKLYARKQPNGRAAGGRRLPTLNSCDAASLLPRAVLRAG